MWEVCNMNRTMNMMIERHNDNLMNKKRTVIVGIVVLFVLIIFSAYFFSKTVTAERNTERTKLVTSVEIKKGDTLWSIASDYMTDEYDDLIEYIEEIKDSNGMISDTIHIGNYIIIPYFADASL